MSALLEVAGLRKRFGAIVVADDVTFSLESGQCLGMIGPNGAGKSSVFNLIAGTIAADGGTIRFEGRELSGEPAHLRARRGIVRAPTRARRRPRRRLRIEKRAVPPRKGR